MNVELVEKISLGLFYSDSPEKFGTGVNLKIKLVYRGGLRESSRMNLEKSFKEACKELDHEHPHFSLPFFQNQSVDEEKILSWIQAEIKKRSTDEAWKNGLFLELESQDRFQLRRLWEV